MTTLVTMLCLLAFLALLAALDCATAPGVAMARSRPGPAFRGVALVVLGPVAIWFYAALCLPPPMKASTQGAADNKFLKG